MRWRCWKSVWRVKYDWIEFELKIRRGEKYSCCMAGNSSAVVQGLCDEAAPAWPKPSSLEIAAALSPALSSIFCGVTAVLGAGICWWKALLFLLGSAECLYGSEQSRWNPMNPCCIFVPSLSRLCWAGAARWWWQWWWPCHGNSCPIPGVFCVLFSLHCLSFLLCHSYVLMNRGRIIFFVI